MKTRRKPRWTTSDNTRWHTIMLDKIWLPLPIAQRERNELERLNRKRMAMIYSGWLPWVKRRIRQAAKWRKKMNIPNE